MARVPVSFYLNIVAGFIVLFNHCVTSETGDVALNKITGAAGRFYTLFQDTARAFQHGCTSRLEIALCGHTVDSVLPHDAVAFLRVHYCQPPAQDSDSVGGTSNDRKLRGGYGGSDFTSMRRTSTEGLGRSPLSLDWSSQSHLAAIGTLLLRSCASWWWFRAPLKMTGVLLGAYTTLLVLSYLFAKRVAMRSISQVYMTIVVDVLRCMEWEAQRQALEIAALMMERCSSHVCS